MFDGRFRVEIERIGRPVGRLLLRTGLSPDHITLFGLLIAIVASIAIGAGHLWVGLALVILSALPDMFDGALAKASNSASQRGAFFDSVIDRISDSFMLGGVAWYLGNARGATAAVLPFAVMSVSSLISYQRAKAESLGLHAKGGLMERAERIIVLCAGLLFSALLYWVMWLMLILTLMTAVQRFIKVWRQAEVAPVTAEKQELRRSRYATRRVRREQFQRRRRAP